jgi:RNA polymerase sigma-70 factor (ECF subfamily)
MNAPLPPEASDDTLLAALRLGQAQAFETLMRRHNRLLFRAARGIVRDDAEAQDAVQEAWLHAFLALRTFRGDASLATWLTRIAINQALTQQRKRGRAVRWEDASHAGSDDMPEESDITTGGRQAASPEDELARVQLQRQLQAALDLLAPIYRSVFMLRAVEGLSVEETALALEVSADVVKTRFLRARALMRARLQEDALLQAPHLHGFEGRRCDDVVTAVLSQLRAGGIIRDH